MTRLHAITLSGLLLWVSATGAFDAPQKVPAGESVMLFDIDDSQLRRARLYYRLAGSRQFLQQPFSQNGSRWRAVLDGASVLFPALEYYAEFHYADGALKTDPAVYPTYNPRRLVVLEQAEFNIRLAANQNDPSSLLFEVTGEVDDDYRVMLDGQDVTYLMARDGNVWRLDNRYGLVDGSMPLQVVDGGGQVVASARVSDPTETRREAKDRELIVRGNASLNAGGQNSSDNAASDLAISGNLHVETEYRNGDFSSHFSGINVNYQHDAEEEFNLSSGFVLTNQYRQHSVELGDVSVEGAPLVLSGFSRRGLNAKTEDENWKASLFNVRTSPVDGWQSGLSFDDRQTYGANVEHRFGEEGTSTLQLSAISGELKQADTQNVGSENPTGQVGDSAALRVSSDIAGISVDAQVAGSSFDADTSDGVAKTTDNAYELALASSMFGLASSLGYHHYGANYATIANPNFSNDREGLNASLGSQIGALGWQMSVSSTEDNVENDPSRPIVQSFNSGLQLSLNVQNWPSLSLGINSSRQASKNEPDVSQVVDNDGLDLSLGISDQFEAVSLSWSTSFGELSDEITLDTSETRNHSLSLGYGGERVKLNLNLSRNETETTATQIANFINLSADLPLFSDDLRLQLQTSIQENTASDGSQDNRIVGGSARMGWSLKQIFGESLKSIGGGSANLSYSFNKTEDALDPTQDVSDSRVMLQFSFGAPVDFEYNWQF